MKSLSVIEVDYWSEYHQPPGIELWMVAIEPWSRDVAGDIPSFHLLDRRSPELPGVMRWLFLCLIGLGSGLVAVCVDTAIDYAAGAGRAGHIGTGNDQP